MAEGNVLYVTSDMIKSVRSDIDFFRTISARKIQCEDIYVYDRIMTLCEQLHISAYGKRQELTITL